MIRFCCPACAKVYKAEREHAGRKTSCKQCGVVVIIPEEPIREVLYGVPLPPNGFVQPEQEELPSPPPPPPSPPPPPRRPLAPRQQAPLELGPDEWDDEDYRPRARRRYRRRRSAMVSAVAVLYLVCGILNFVCAALIFVGASVLAELGAEEVGARVAIGSLGGLLAILIVLFGVPDILAALGIWNRRYWGRILGLVLAGLNGLWALASIFWGDVCSVFVCGGCSIFALVVLCNARYAAEFP